MSAYRPYPKYKDSGVEWLGEVPAHWTVSRLGFETWVRARLGWKGLKAEEYVDDGFAFLATPNIKGHCIDFENVNFITQNRFDESPEIKVREGDVLLAKDGSTLGIVNVVRSLPRPTTVNSSIAVITPNRTLDGIFLYFLFASSYMKHTIHRIKGGMGVPHLFQADLNKFSLPLPPLPEQIQIATFLDRECGKLDALQAKQERLIALLKEKRQALISHAVTKGLDPNAKLKPSGIEWLGDVPVHWKLVSFGQCVAITGGQVDPTMEPFLDYVMIAPNHIESKMGRILALETAAEQCAESGKYLCKQGDVIYSKIRPALAKACLCPQEQVLCSADMYPMRGMLGLTNEFLLKILLSAEFTAFAIMESDRVAMPKLNRETLATTRLPIPPLAEQRAIVAHLDDKCGKIDQLKAKAERAIALLKERRSALISAAVTGKIDVRDVAADCIRPAQLSKKRHGG